MKVVHSACALLLLPHGHECKHGGIREYVTPCRVGRNFDCKITRMLSEQISFDVISLPPSLSLVPLLPPLNESPSPSYKYSLFPRCIIAVLSPCFMWSSIWRTNGHSSSDVLYISAVSERDTANISRVINQASVAFVLRTASERSRSAYAIRGFEGFVSIAIKRRG